MRQDPPHPHVTPKPGWARICPQQAVSGSPGASGTDLGPQLWGSGVAALASGASQHRQPASRQVELSPRASPSVVSATVCIS